MDGVLTRDGGGGDILTVEEFGDFELSLDGRLRKGGNSGIFFHVIKEGDERGGPARSIQVLDNAVHRDGKNPITSAGSNYAVHPPTRDVTKPIGEWNTVRTLVKGAHVEHWLNGVKMVEYELWSADWDKRVKASKFGKIPLYGRPSADTSRCRTTAIRCGTATSRSGPCDQLQPSETSGTSPNCPYEPAVTAPAAGIRASENRCLALLVIRIFAPS